jgi:hypothetical protein
MENTRGYFPQHAEDNLLVAFDTIAFGLVKLLFRLCRFFFLELTIAHAA